jgi:hypothetical protein
MIYATDYPRVDIYMGGEKKERISSSLTPMLIGCGNRVEVEVEVGGELN